MKATHTARRYYPRTLLICSVLVGLCVSFSARLDVSSYAPVSASIAEQQSIGGESNTFQAHALVNSTAAWAHKISSQAKTRARRPSAGLDALPSGRDNQQPARGRFSPVQNFSDTYSHVFNFQPQGRAPPHVA